MLEAKGKPKEAHWGAGMCDTPGLELRHNQPVQGLMVEQKQ